MIDRKIRSARATGAGVWMLTTLALSVSPAVAEEVAPEEVVLDGDGDSEATVEETSGVVEETTGIVETTGVEETSGGVEESDGIEIVETTGGSMQDLAGADATLIVPFTGPRSKTVQERVRQALARDGISMSPPGFEGDRKFGTSPIEYVGFGQETGVRGFIDGKVEMKDNVWSVAMNVRSAHNGGVVGQASLSAEGLPALLKEIDARATEVLGEALAKTQMADPNGPAPTIEVQLRPDFANAPPPEPPQKEKKQPPPSPLEARVGAAFMLRNFDYTDSVADSYEFYLVPHTNVGLPMPMVEARWYPGAHSMRGLVTHIGLDVAFRRSVAGNTVMFGTDYPTVFQELLYGVRGRIPVGDHELGLAVGLGRQTLEVQGDNDRLNGVAGNELDPGILPDVTYNMFRAGVDGRVQLSEMFSIQPSVYVRTATLSSDLGQVAEPRWFPKATADGVEARLALGIQFTESFGLLAGADVRQYGLFMNVDQDAALSADRRELNQAVAGGATDLYLGGFAVLTYRLPGKAR